MKDGRNGRPRDRPEVNAKLYDLLGNFVATPVELVDEGLELSDGEVRMYLILRRYVNNTTGNAYPSYSLIQQLTGWSRVTISKHAKKLEEKHWMIRETTPQQNTNYYLTKPSEWEEQAKKLGKLGSTENVLGDLPLDDTVSSGTENVLPSTENVPPLVQKMYSIYMNEIDLENRSKTPSLRSGGAEASQAQPSAPIDSSFQEDETASDNGLIISNSPQTETEDLEARWIAECQGNGAVAGTRETGIFSLLIRPMLASEFSEGYTDSEIGASSTLEEPPLSASPPRAPKTQPRRRQRAKRATPETAGGRNSDPVAAVGQKPANSSRKATSRLVVDGITSDHPAVRAVSALLRRKPNHEAWPRIVGVLGEEWDQDKLVLTYREWVSRGFNPFNLSGWLFRWYPEGIPEAGERSSANVYGSRDPQPRPRINQTEFCGRNGCRRGWIKSAGGLAACSCNLQERGAWK